MITVEIVPTAYYSGSPDNAAIHLTDVKRDPICTSCGKEPGAYDVRIDGQIVMLAGCLTCIANLSGQLAGAAMALVQQTRATTTYE